MNIYEYGIENEKTVLFIAVAAMEPYWAFKDAIELLAKDYHVYAAAADGHEPGVPGYFTSVEKTAADIADELRKRGVTRIDAAYGLSMGGAIALRFIIASGIIVDKAVIDGGITPYPYPKIVCRLISVKDFAMAWMLTRSRRILEAVAPPERYTPKGHDPEAEYDSLMDFYRNTYSARSIYNDFWSANNYELPVPMPDADTQITYWYGEYEEKARKADKIFLKEYCKMITFSKISGYGHGELVMVYPKAFYEIFEKTMKGELQVDKGKTDYKNWVPKGMIAGFGAGTAALATANAAGAVLLRSSNRKIRVGAKAILGLALAGCSAMTAWSVMAYKAFSYDGKRKLSKAIVEGTAEYINIPEGGAGLDVGCGSGALTIACAKRNPEATMVGIDRWGAEYASFSKNLCENNAEAEGVTNVSFSKGDAVHLDYPDETFDAVTSNYVYHNITGVNKQDLLKETLRVLKKGGTFAIHDIMSKDRYGDMDRFAQELRDGGYQEVRLIRTDDGMFMTKQEAIKLMLRGSTLLVGVK